MKGKVVQARSGNNEYQHEDLKPHSFLIKGDDGKEYLCHLGDIKTNEDKIYKLTGVTYLKENEEVEFTPEIRPHAIRVVQKK